MGMGHAPRKDDVVGLRLLCWMSRKDGDPVGEQVEVGKRGRGEARGGELTERLIRLQRITGSPVPSRGPRRK